jgi:guanylate kinase
MSNERDDWANLPGKLIVLSGPSGSGKSTLAKRLLGLPNLRLKVSISATTRSPRPAEQPGRDYLFLTKKQFAQMRDELLESAQVHGNDYGTPAEPVRRAMAAGDCVLLVIDVQGGLQVRKRVHGALLIFIQPPSPETLESRLRARGTDDEPTIERRLAGARRELELAASYDVHVINDDLDRAVDDLTAILTRTGCGARNDHD